MDSPRRTSNGTIVVDSSRSPFAVDGDDWAAEVGAIFSVFDRIDVEPVAVRGDRLTLVRLRCVREPDFASSWLALYEYDEQGRLAHEIDFDEGDLAAALAELDRSYFFGEGAPHQRLLTICDKFGSVSLRDDTAELADFVAAGVRVRRPPTARIRRG